jgi:hypothetical protein
MNERHRSTLIVLALALSAGAVAAAQPVRAPASGPTRSASPGLHAFRKALIIYDRRSALRRSGRKQYAHRSFPLLLRDLPDEIVRRRLAVPDRVPTSRYGRLTVLTKRVSSEDYRPKENVEALWLSMTLTLQEGRKADAGEILDEIIDQLRTLLKERYETYTTELREDLSATTAQLKADRAELEKVRVVEKGLRKSVSKDIDYEEMDHQLKQHSRSAAAFRLELAGKRARLRAALRKIDEIRMLAQKKADDDPVTKELTQLVRIREDGVKRQEQLVRQGAADMASLQSAQGRLAEAKVRLIERKESILQLAGGDVLARLNEELAVLGLDTVELEAKGTMIEAMSVELRKQRKCMLDHTEAETRIAQLEEAISKYEAKPQQLRERLDECDPPSLTVVGKDPDTQPFHFGSGSTTPVP